MRHGAIENKRQSRAATGRVMDSELPLVIGWRPGLLLTRQPVGFGRPIQFEAEKIFTHKSRHQTHRRDDEQEEQRENDVRHHKPKDECHTHPREVNPLQRAGQNRAK